MRMNIKEVWEGVGAGQRHWNRCPAVKKNEELIDRCLEKIDIDTEGSIVDWGCGGGYLSRRVGCKKVHFVDIVTEHLEGLGDKNADYFDEIEVHDVSDNIQLDLSGEIEVLIAFSILYHMPSLNYVRGVVEEWERIQPKYILIRSLFMEGPSWESPYAIYFNYLRGNLFNKNEFLSMFPSYTVLLDKPVYGVGGSLNDVHGTFQHGLAPHSSRMLILERRND